MANPLTGDYEAVLQISTRQINGLLATLHNDSDRDARIAFIRSIVTRVGDPRRVPPDLVDFHDWVISLKSAAPGESLRDLRSHVTATAPAGIAKTFSETLDRFTDEWEFELPPTPPDVVRGIVKAQVSTVTINVSNGSSSEVTVNAHVRAKFYPDSGTNSLPEPIHGRVSATFRITPQHYRGRLRLIIKPTEDDSKIQFVTAANSGMSSFDQNRIAEHVRKFVRESLVQPPVDVPAEFPFTEFRGLGSSGNQLIALPLQLPGGTLPANRISTITQSFIGSNGFAVAISEDHVKKVIDLKRIEEEIEQGGSYLSYTFEVLTLEASCEDTFIKVSGNIALKSPYLTDGWVSFSQRIRLGFDPGTENISVFRLGDPDVDESWFLPHDPVFKAVRRQLDISIPRANQPINAMISDNKTTIVDGLNDWVPEMGASFTAVHITTDGIIFSGEFSGGARSAPVVKVEEAHGGTAFTALKSWVPGGRIDKFVWSWVEYPNNASIWNGTPHEQAEEHSFIFPKPAGITGLSQICLRVEGTQVLPSGAEISVVGGSTCLVKEPEFALDVPSWWGPLTVPIWRPVPGDRGPLRRAIAGHMSVASTSPDDGKPQSPALVYFADDRPLDALFEALRLSKNAGSVTTTVVVPAGTFDMSRTEVETLLGMADNGAARVVITEDDEGAWTKAFDVSKVPSAYLMSAKRELTWQNSGEVNPAELAAVIDALAVHVRPSAFRPATLNIAPGDSPRNVTFVDHGDQYALHHLRGRDVLLNFWQSWSAPCLEELERLQSLSNGHTGPFVAAFHGGTSAEPIDEIRKRLGLSFALVQDSQQRLARHFGIRCWPTTIKIAADGRVEHVQLGTSHNHGRPRPKAK